MDNIYQNIISDSHTKLISKTISTYSLDLLTRVSETNNLIQQLKEFDSKTYQHSLRVSFYAVVVAMEYGLSMNKLIYTAEAGVLHDIGKMKVDINIIQKKGTLSESEWEIMRQHPQFGYEMIKDTFLSKEVLDGVLYHHERVNGKGYLQGLNGKSTPIIAQIIAIADSFDAMITKRHYKDAMPVQDALANLHDQGYNKIVVNCLERAILAA